MFLFSLIFFVSFFFFFSFLFLALVDHFRQMQVPIVIMKTKDMRNSTNIFLINLSIADLFVLVVCTPTVLVEVNTKPETWILGHGMCKQLIYLSTFFLAIYLCTITTDWACDIFSIKCIQLKLTPWKNTRTYSPESINVCTCIVHRASYKFLRVKLISFQKKFYSKFLHIYCAVWMENLDEK